MSALPESFAALLAQGTIFVDNEFRPAAAGETFATVDPSTELPVAEVSRGRAADVDRAARAASAAMAGPWAAITPRARADMLVALADRLLAAKEDLALIETLDVGKPLKESRGDVNGVVQTFRYNAGGADKMEGTTVPLGPDVIDFTLLEPLGATAHIIPWNYPLGMLARSVAPALAAGCTVVIKPAEQSPLSALLFADICRQAGFPPGVVNVVTGFGEEAGAPLTEHPAIRGITFTGSVETGRRVYLAAARGIKPVVLELGGKNPMIVLEDADLDRAAFDAVDATFGNTGQVCSSSSRFLLHHSIREAFLDRLAAHAEKLTVGAGVDDCDLGPLASQEQYGKVQAYLEAGRSGGGRLRLGGGRPAHLNRGYFIEPTIFDKVTPDAVIAREEIFGPVGVAIDIASAEEGLAIANGLGFGLTAGIYSQDISRALRLARQIEAGSVWVNGWFLGGVQAPTGGIKDSGIGRERGLPGIRNYLGIKNVAVRL